MEEAAQLRRGSFSTQKGTIGFEAAAKGAQVLPSGCRDHVLRQLSSTDDVILRHRTTSKTQTLKVSRAGPAVHSSSRADLDSGIDPASRPRLLSRAFLRRLRPTVLGRPQVLSQTDRLFSLTSDSRSAGEIKALQLKAVSLGQKRLRAAVDTLWYS